MKIAAPTPAAPLLQVSLDEERQPGSTVLVLDESGTAGLAVACPR
jgi:hypothetical protein